MITDDDIRRIWYGRHVAEFQRLAAKPKLTKGKKARLERLRIGVEAGGPMMPMVPRAPMFMPPPTPPREMNPQLLILGNPPPPVAMAKGFQERMGNPPRFTTIDPSGTIVYSKVATGTGGVAFRAAYNEAVRRADQTGQTHYVWLSLQHKKGDQLNLPLLPGLTPVAPGASRRRNPISWDRVLTDVAGGIAFGTGGAVAERHVIPALLGKKRKRNAANPWTETGLWHPSRGSKKSSRYMKLLRQLQTATGKKRRKLMEEIDEIRPSMNPVSGPADPHAATELRLFIDNDADLYRQQYIPIIQNLMRKRAAGKYDREKAVKLWMYLVENGAKKYAAQFAHPSQWSEIFNKNTRLEVARGLRDSFEAEADLGNYDQYIPKKYRKNPRYGKRARKFIPKKIRKLMREGYPQEQAIAISMSMARRKGMKVPKRKRNPKGLPPVPPHIMNDPAFRRELKIFRKRHGGGPVEIFRVNVPDGYPKYMTAYGQSPVAYYDAHRTSPKGKRKHFFGEGGKSKPFLVSSSQKGRKFLSFVGGDFRAEPDWIHD